MANYEIRLHGGDKGAVIQIIDKLRDGLKTHVYSTDKKKGIIIVEGVDNREVLDAALKKYVPSGIRFDSILELPEENAPREERSAFYDMRRRLEAAEDGRDQMAAELREATKREEEGKGARRALVEIKERLQKETEVLRKSKEAAEIRYEELFRQFDKLATTKANPKDAGITGVMNFASRVKTYDDKFDEILKDAGSSVEEMLKAGGMSLVECANSVLGSQAISTEVELDDFGNPPTKHETDEYVTAKDELKFIEDLAEEKISGIPKHLIPNLVSAIDHVKDEEIVKKYEAKLDASGKISNIRKTYSRAAKIKSEVEAVKKEGVRIPYFIANGEEGEERTVEIFSPSGATTGAISKLISERVQGALKVLDLPEDVRIEGPVSRGRFSQISLRLPKSDYSLHDIADIQRIMAQTISDAELTDILTELGFSFSAMELSTY